MADEKESIHASRKKNNWDLSGMTDNQIASRLHRYVTNGETEKLEVLLDAIVAANLKNDNESNSKSKNFSILKNKFSKFQSNLNSNSKDKWDINFILNKFHNEDGLTIFLLASYINKIDAIKVLLDFNSKNNNSIIDINIKQAKTKVNALYYACLNNNTAIVQLLMKNGCDPNTIDKRNNHTCLFHACKNGNKRIIESLLSKTAKIPFRFEELINSASFEEQRMTAFEICCRSDHLECVKLLYDENVKNYNNSIDLVRDDLKYLDQHALKHAIHYNRDRIIKYLIKNVYHDLLKTNQVNIRNTSPMACAAHWGNIDLIEFFNKECGIDINFESWGTECDTALHTACDRNRAKCVFYLANHDKIDINYVSKRSKLGKTGLMCAIESGSYECVKSLLKSKNGSKVDMLNILDKKGYNAIDYCAIFGFSNIFRLLMKELMFKRRKVNNWQTFIKSNLFSDDNVKRWLNLAKEHQCQGFLAFLNNIVEIMKDNYKSYDNSDKWTLIYTSINSDASNLVENNIKQSEENFKKDNTIANYLIKNLQKCSLDDLCDVINNAVNKQECPMNDSLLFLSMQHNKNELIKCLVNCTKSSLSAETKNSYNYNYFKTNLLHSNIWAAQGSLHGGDGGDADDVDVKTDDNDNMNNAIDIKENLLFRQIENEVIKKELEKQQLFIKENIVKEEKSNEQDWFELRNSIQDYNCGQDEIITQNVLNDRYDNFENIMKEKGLQSDYSLKELPNSNISQYNNDGYLTKLLIHASQFNPTFQKDCENIFNKKNLGVNCIYHDAPIKTKERSMMKALLDYNNRQFPQTSSIIDFVRCSVTFNDCSDFITGFLNFQNMVKNDQTGCIKKIVRIKNGFKSISDESWNCNDLSKFDYCDIKANVIIEINNIGMIAEIQFLLKFMSDAKSMGHSIYGYVRKSDFYHDLSKQLYSKKETSKLNQIENIVFSKNISQLFLLLSNGTQFERQLIVKEKEKIESLINAAKWKQGKQLFDIVVVNGSYSDK